MENERIRQCRLRKGLTQREVANAIYVAPNTYSRYESGDRKIDIKTIVQLAKFFNTTTDYLLGMPDSSENKQEETD